MHESECGLEVKKLGTIGNFAQARSIFSGGGISPTLIAGMSHGNIVPYVLEIYKMGEQNYIDVPTIVKVRKNEVDISKLQTVLRQSKKSTGYTNKEIAERLNVKQTKVEHWFRTDSGFAVPDTDIWFDLKKMLKINTDVFDDSITEFEERDGVYEMSDRLYLQDKIAPTIKCGDSFRTLEITKMGNNGCNEIGRMDNSDGSLEIANRVYGDDGCSPCLNAHANDTVPKVLEVEQIGNRMQEIIKVGQMPGFESDNRVYSTQGICPSIKIGGDPKKIIEVNKLGNVYGFDGGSYDGNVYDKEGLCPTMRSCMCHGSVPEVAEMSIVATRSRDKDNPTGYRGKSNGNMEQVLEPNAEGISNTITTVQKDNLVLIKQATKDGYVPCEVGGGMRLELPKQYHTKGQGNRERTDKSNTDNGEYP